MVRILVAEDDQTLLEVMCKVLQKNGYTALPARDGDEALEILEREHVDLLISDIMMPGTDGFALAEELRGAGYDFPILMCTARGQIEDKERGYAVGIDDYMVKPINMRELVLRIQALFRRSKIAASNQLEFGNIILDAETLTVTRRDETVILSQKEFQVLFKLLSYPGKIFTRQALMEEIWGLESNSDERTVDVHINRLRDKFFSWGAFSIVTVRGLGYKAVRVDEA